MERLSTDYAGRAVVAKLDIDANPGTAGRFDVRSIPTVLFFQHGKLVDRTVGALPHELFTLKFDQLLGAATDGPGPTAAHTHAERSSALGPRNHPRAMRLTYVATPATSAFPLTEVR